MKITRPVYSKTPKKQRNDPPFWRWFRPVGTIAKSGDKYYKLVWSSFRDGDYGMFYEKLWEEISGKEHMELEHQYHLRRIKNKLSRGFRA